MSISKTQLAGALVVLSACALVVLAVENQLTTPNKLTVANRITSVVEDAAPADAVWTDPYASTTVYRFWDWTTSGSPAVAVDEGPIGYNASLEALSSSIEVFQGKKRLLLLDNGNYQFVPGGHVANVVVHGADYSMSYWVYPTQSSAIRRYIVIVNGPGSRVYHYHQQSSTGVTNLWNIWCYSGSYSFNLSFEPYQWYHIGFSWNDTSNKYNLYTNGVHVGEKTIAWDSSFGFTDNPNYGHTANSFGCYLDNLIEWSNVVSAADFQAIYAAGVDANYSQ